MRTKKKLLPFKDSDRTRKYAFEKSLRYLTIRSRSVKEVYEYLLKKNFSEETVNHILERLIQEKFLDDKEFAAQWIESRQKYRGKSKYIIRHELKNKGVNDQDIEGLMKNAQDDLITARLLYDKRKDKIRHSDHHDFNNKMGAFLARRGFSWEIIRKVLNEND